MNRILTPVKVGLLFAVIGILLTLVGIVRGNVPTNPGSIIVALLIGGGVWYLVSWAVAAAAFDVEADVAVTEAALSSQQNLESPAND